MRKKLWRGAAGSAVGIAAVIALGVVAYGQALPALGVPETEVREYTIRSIFGATVSWVGQAVFKAASPAQRTTLVQGSIAWAKAFTQSAAFKTAYDTVRARSRPQPPTEEPANDLAQQRADFEKQVVAGRAPVTAARTAVQAWLTELVR